MDNSNQPLNESAQKNINKASWPLIVFIILVVIAIGVAWQFTGSKPAPIIVEKPTPVIVTEPLPEKVVVIPEPIIVEPELEIVAEACNVNQQPYQYILLKKEKSLDVQSKNFELNPGFDNRNHLEIAVEAYSWLKKDISSVHQNISYKEDQQN